MNLASEHRSYNHDRAPAYLLPWFFPTQKTTIELEVTSTGQEEVSYDTLRLGSWADAGNSIELHSEIGGTCQ